MLCLIHTHRRREKQCSWLWNSFSKRKSQYILYSTAHVVICISVWNSDDVGCTNRGLHYHCDGCFSYFTWNKTGSVCIV
jgi:hypothetical protein